MSRRGRTVVATPRQVELGLVRIANGTGLSVSLLPNGAPFDLEYEAAARRILINQMFGSPIAFGMGRLFLRLGGKAPATLTALGPGSASLVGHGEDRFVWQGEDDGLGYRLTLWLHADSTVWFWRFEVDNRGSADVRCDAVFVQDLGLGEQGFLMGNEAYASQYLDHAIFRHRRVGDVVMSRQNLAQSGIHPWVAHGCLEGAAGYATDIREVMGPGRRDADGLGLRFGKRLSSIRVQYETACAAIQSRPARLRPGEAATWTFFGAFVSDHPAATSTADLNVVDEAERASAAWRPKKVGLSKPERSLVDSAPAAVAERLDGKAISTRYPRRLHVERKGSRVLSFFSPSGAHNRHVVLRDKERIVLRRHGAILRSGGDMAPSEAALSTTCWMQGVFAAQLTIGNTSFHKLFSVSREPYNLARGGGLRILAEIDGAWRLLTIPSAFEMGLGDCVWVYKFAKRTITITAIVSAEESVVTWLIRVDGAPCRFLIFGQLVLGEHEYAHAGQMEVDTGRKIFTFRPDPDDSLWGRRYPLARYCLVTSTPTAVDEIGADELLHADGKRRTGAYAAIRTLPTRSFAFSVVGSLSDERQAEALAAKYSGRLDEAEARERSDKAWRAITRGLHIQNATGEARAINTIFPWFVHDAMIHLCVPHGLEQYTGAAWGTRDVCQGPLELFLSLEHDGAAKAILQTVFAQQYEEAGDWPQWFMLEPYSAIQDPHAHGDVVVWPLKALCDYVEATGDFDFLGEHVAWRREDNFEKTAHTSAVVDHIDKLVQTVRARFLPGTHLIRYGNGDWNDSLQPVDAAMRDWMVSSWTVALLYQQLRRYAEILRRCGRGETAETIDGLAAAMAEDFHRFLVRDGVVAGYGVFGPQGGPPELLIHPGDTKTGLFYSLIPMTQALIGGLFRPEEAQDHLAIIEKQLLFPDGARLMERPLQYRGGVETFFRRAESAAFFGREIGLMYVHSHLRFAEAMSLLGKNKAMWDALMVANPITVTERLANASLRQRNAYFSSSDAAFHNRYEASAKWKRVKSGREPVDGGWRIYSSGPGLYAYVLVQHTFGLRRRFGERVSEPRLPRSERNLKLISEGGPSSPDRRHRPRIRQ
jgi:cellobiose phosphorylase